MSPWLRALGVVVALSSTGVPAAEPPPFPTHAIRIVVPFAAGGPADIAARELAQYLGAEWKQRVVVENRPGAGGSIGSDLVAKAAPDGHTVVVGATSTHAANQTLFPDLPYDVVKDFAPITMVAITPNVLVVRQDSGIRSLADLVDAARTGRDAMAFGSGGPGTAGHLAGELFRMTTGTPVFHVPYKGAVPAMQALLAGDTTFMFASTASVTAQVRAGTLRALAVTTGSRTRLMPDVPTMAEAGMAGFDMATWYGILAPAGTPPAIIARWNADAVRILNLPDVRAQMAAMGAEVTTSGSAEFATFIAREVPKYARIIKQSGATFD